MDYRTSFKTYFMIWIIEVNISKACFTGTARPSETFFCSFVLQIVLGDYFSTSRWGHIFDDHNHFFIIYRPWILTEILKERKEEIILILKKSLQSMSK